MEGRWRRFGRQADAFGLRFNSLAAVSLSSAVSALALALLTACGSPEGEKSAVATQAKAKIKAGTLKITTVQKEFLAIEPAAAASGTDVVVLPGRIGFRPQAQFAVGALVPGRVSALLVRSGEAVKAGAPLLTIDSSDAAGARATLDQTATRLANAEIVYKRQVMMVDKGVGLEAERQEAEVRLKEARAEHERARNGADLVGTGKGNRITLRAPADGVVMTIRTAVGATVAPGGDALLELGDPSRLQVLAQVSESELPRVAVGQVANVTLAALATTVEARVESVNPRVDPESRRTQVYLAPARRIEGLRDGMLAQIALRVSGDQNVVVPTSAVLIKDGKRRVVYVELPDGNFEARDVETGRNQDGRVAILKGLASGERIVVRGALLLDAQAEQLL